MQRKKIILKQEKLETIKFYKEEKKLFVSSSRGSGLFLLNMSEKMFCSGENLKDKFKIDFFLSGNAEQSKFHTQLKMLLEGISKGYFFELNLRGVGYKCNFISPKLLFLNLGYSHSILYKIHNNVTVFLKKGKIYLYSFSKEDLGTVVADLKNLRIPDVYKAKGIIDSKRIYTIKEGKKR